MGVYRLYKTEAPYLDTDVGSADFAQTADVMYMAHTSYPPVKLARYGHTDWRWSEVTFGSSLTAPTGSAVATSPNTTGAFAVLQEYVITSTSDAGEESIASAVFSTSNDLSLSGNFNTITVPAPSGTVTAHTVYKKQGGVFGYIGATDTTSLVDQNIQPVTSLTPPQGYSPFDADGDYPGVVTFHQQRLLWGGTSNVINGVWGSRSAQPENMDKSRPARADDGLSFALLADKVNAITGLCSVEDLLCLTTDSIFAVQGNTSGTLTPTEINPKRTSGRGARKVKPLVIDTVVFFVTSRGKAIRTLGFSFDVQGYKSDNVTIFAPHLFVAGIQKIVYQEEPYSVVYTLLTDGTLLAFTWEAEQEVWGWSRIETDGTFEDIEIIPESSYDRLYARIRRSFGVFHERMALPHEDIEQACHLDCSYTRTFTDPVTRITGAYHLVGQTVSMIFDGYVAHDLEVSECDGGVDVPQGASASTITVGIRYSGRLETLPFPLTGQAGSNHVNRQQIKDLVVRTVDTRGIEIGTSGTPLEQVEPKDGDEVTELTDVTYVDYRVDVPGNWTDSTTVVVEQNEPLPAHITAIHAGMLVAND